MLKSRSSLSRKKPEWILARQVPPLKTSGTSAAARSLEDHAAEIILFDQAWGESRLLGGKPDRLAQLVGRLFVPDYAPAARDGATLGAARNPGNRTAGRGKRTVELAQQGLNDAFALEQGADPADRSPVAVAQRELDEIRRLDSPRLDLAPDPAVSLREAAEAGPIVDGVDRDRAREE